MKVQSKLVGNTPTQEIDWNTPQLLVFTGSGSKFIVLTSGVKHDDRTFESVVVATTVNSWRLGEYSLEWAKDTFKPLHPNQQVILQNTSDEPNPTSE
jgi:hypothetical protein